MRLQPNRQITFICGNFAFEIYKSWKTSPAETRQASRNRQPDTTGHNRWLKFPAATQSAKNTTGQTKLDTLLSSLVRLQWTPFDDIVMTQSSPADIRQYRMFIKQSERFWPAKNRRNTQGTKTWRSFVVSGCNHAHFDTRKILADKFDSTPTNSTHYFSKKKMTHEINHLDLNSAIGFSVRHGHNCRQKLDRKLDGQNFDDPVLLITAATRIFQRKRKLE